jgi:hypothetical protein
MATPDTRHGPAPSCEAMATSEEILTLADQDWTFGQLASARRGYGDAERADPGSWHAAFQAAWIDAAFGPLDPGRLKSLDRPGLGAGQSKRLSMLRSAKPTLSGGPADWDIETLRKHKESSSAAFWEKRAAEANAANQFGLAMACYREAEHLAPSRYYDPPREMQALPLVIEQHLNDVRG